VGKGRHIQIRCDDSVFTQAAPYPDALRFGFVKITFRAFEGGFGRRGGRIEVRAGSMSDDSSTTVYEGKLPVDDPQVKIKRLTHGAMDAFEVILLVVGQNRRRQSVKVYLTDSFRQLFILAGQAEHCDLSD